MSAGATAASYHLAKPTNDVDYLAPLFRAAVERAIAECNDPINNLSAMVYETYRSNELQEVYYARGREVIPPPEPVTNARTNLYSWHGYGLAVDVIHKSKGWDPGDKWFRDVAAIFKKHGCKWGGDWTSPDRPHFQWGKCKPSPSPVARELMTTRGVEAVWEAVGAIGPVAIADA
jgi:peptidoglycan L-alanyl-D-glutamate endopeptidase CwlK